MKKINSKKKWRICIGIFDHESVSLVVIVLTSSYIIFINISIIFINISIIFINISRFLPFCAHNWVPFVHIISTILFNSVVHIMFTIPKMTFVHMKLTIVFNTNCGHNVYNINSILFVQRQRNSKSLWGTQRDSERLREILRDSERFKEIMALAISSSL